MKSDSSVFDMCSAAAQLSTYGKSARALTLSGLPLLAAGLALMAIAGGISSLVLLLIAIVAAGAGHGLVFLGGLTTFNRAAPAGAQAEMVSIYYVFLYLGVSVPVIGVGFLATVSGLLTAVPWFAGVVAVLCLVMLGALRRFPANTLTA
jgi:hypothetical protein